MKLHPIRFFVWLSLAVVLGAASATAQNNRHQIKGRLTGYQEPPAISSTGAGDIRGQLRTDSNRNPH